MNKQKVHPLFTVCLLKFLHALAASVVFLRGTPHLPLHCPGLNLGDGSSRGTELFLFGVFLDGPAIKKTWCRYMHVEISTDVAGRKMARDYQSIQHIKAGMLRARWLIESNPMARAI